MNKNEIDIHIMYISLIFKSNGANLWFFKFIPNVASNQHLEKPIKPRTLAMKNNKIVKVGVNSNRPQKI